MCTASKCRLISIKQPLIGRTRLSSKRGWEDPTCALAFVQTDAASLLGLTLALDR